MFDEIVPLEPVHFFAFQFDCHYLKGKSFEKKHLLPDLSSFHDGRPFAQVSMGWNANGIYLQLNIHEKFDQPDFPNFSSSDSIELFFDTRDVKTTGYATRYCHHFYFLPDPLENDDTPIQAGEITRFRSDSVHELCDASLLRIESHYEKKNRVLTIFIPSECLYGYDPTEFDRLGFTYRINRINGSKQFFAASDVDFAIESQPSLWASLKLLKEK